MTEDDDELRAELFDGELDALKRGRADDVPGDADDEELAEALVEEELRRDA